MFGEIASHKIAKLYNIVNYFNFSTCGQVNIRIPKNSIRQHWLAIVPYAYLLPSIPQHFMPFLTTIFIPIAFASTFRRMHPAIANTTMCPILAVCFLITLFPHVFLLVV
jgi:hypothetical protein